jgi:hypothetical protein
VVRPTTPSALSSLIDEMVAREPTARPTAAEVRERATTIAMVEPPRAITSDFPKHVEDSPSSFTIRIHRSGTGS